MLIQTDLISLTNPGPGNYEWLSQICYAGVPVPDALALVVYGDLDHDMCAVVSEIQRALDAMSNHERLEFYAVVRRGNDDQD